MRDSLKNLQLDYIDLLIVHKNDPNCPLEGKNLKFDNMSSGRAQVPNKVSSTMLENSIRALINFNDFSSTDIDWRFTFYVFGEEEV